MAHTSLFMFDFEEEDGFCYTVKSFFLNFTKVFCLTS